MCWKDRSNIFKDVVKGLFNHIRGERKEKGETGSLIFKSLGSADANDVSLAHCVDKAYKIRIILVVF